MYNDEDLLPISALQHLVFCPRQCGLMYIEGLWVENMLTMQGNLIHERTHEPDSETRGDLHIARGLRIHSLNLGLSGQCDVVEFHRLSDNAAPQVAGVILKGLPGRWQPFPVEYKRGKPKPDDCDLVQVCAQAMCLEEMLGAPIHTGALYYNQPKRRTNVAFDTALRNRVGDLCHQLRELISSEITPEPEVKKRCQSCSLQSACMPQSTGKSNRASRYVQSILNIIPEE